jgi:hypothetical protein
MKGLEEFPSDVDAFYDKVYRGAELEEGQIVFDLRKAISNPDIVLISNGKIEYAQTLTNIQTKQMSVNLVTIETELDSNVVNGLFELALITVELQQKSFEAHLHDLPDELIFRGLTNAFLNPNVLGRKDQLIGLLKEKRDKMNNYIEALTFMPTKHLFGKWYFEEKEIRSADDEFIMPIEEGQKLFNFSGVGIGAKTYTKSEMQELIDAAGDTPENHA